MGVWLWQSKPNHFNWMTARRAKTEKSTSNSVIYEGFADCLYHEFLPQRHMVNKVVLRRLWEVIPQKLTELRKMQSWILHHINTPACTLMLMHGFLAKHKIVIIPQPPCSPDLTPDPPTFSSSQDTEKGKHFAMIEEIKEKPKQELLAIPIKRVSLFRGLEKCWH